MPTDHRAALAAIKRFDQLIAYLKREMGWPIEGDDFEELTFDFTPEELGIDARNAAKIQEIKRLRPLAANQPWGIFFVKFEPKKLPVVALRRILSQVALKKRASANSDERAAWAADDLLFISNYGEGEERQISFAHFSTPPDGRDLPTLKVLGWDNLDTALHLDAVAKELREHLAWPDDESNLEDWRSSWRSAFTLRHDEVVTTSKELSIRLAKLARAIRQRIQSALAIETEHGPLTKLLLAFQRSLIHDLDADGFADMYAQTIAYGLLSARIANPTKKTVDDLAGHMRTNPFLRELMETFLKVGGRRGKAGGPGIDFDELGVSEVVQLLDTANMEAVVRDFGDKNPQEDPVIHFYELFLKEYDAKKRMQRGVFYTPRPVVSYIVRSVHELLQTEFGLEDGLADTATWGDMCARHPGLTLPNLQDDLGKPYPTSPDEPFVQILDPATGTATFLVEVIEVIHQTLKTKWQKQGLSEAQQIEAWNDYVPEHLLPRLHGYELMMAPYAIAHMKIGLKLAETGYRFAIEARARIYLTNALEPWMKQLKLPEFDALAHEAVAVNEIKRNKRFTVVIGNPPYSHLSSNMAIDIMAIVEPYKFINGERIQERGALSLQKNLQDDYVKFFRIAERIIETIGHGILGLITNNSYLDSRSFRGMRHHLSQSFSKAWILDLHGSGKKDEAVGEIDERDANVFDIMQGVAVSIWSRPIEESATRIMREDLLGGRERKYQFLVNQTVATTMWKQLQLAPPFFNFVQQDINLLTEYQALVSLREIFPVYSSGVKTHRDDFAYSFTPWEMEDKLREFCDCSIDDDNLRRRYGLKDTNVWSLQRQRSLVNLPTLVDSIKLALYRPFDIRATCFADEIIELARRAIMDHMEDVSNLALLCSQQQAEEGYRHVFCTRLISDWGSVSNRTRESTSAFPLWLSRAVRKSLSQNDLYSEEGLRPNVNPAWLTVLGTAEGVFHYVYSLLHAPSYRLRYAAFLRSDFPRLPLTGNLELSRSLARLGSELTALHLLESPRLDQPITHLIGKPRQVIKVGWTDDTVWLDAGGTRAATTAGTSGFKGVPEAVWNFHIGGYQVCEKWLKDRKGRTLTDDDLAHYQKIVVALSETIRLMAEIDQVIDEHGGWPGAFQAATVEVEDAS